MAVQLPHTLQTWVGMVQRDGAPEPRNYPDKVAHINDTFRRQLSKALPPVKEYGELEPYNPSETVLDYTLKYLQDPNISEALNPNTYSESKLKRYAANLSACVSDVSKDDLKRYIKLRTRFDLEQAAGIVVSAFMKDDRVDEAMRLVKELGVVLGTSCMWVDSNAPLPTQPNVFASPENLAKKLKQSAAKKGIDIPLATSYAELVPLLMRVRRCKPDNRCLHIPQWMFEEAGIDPPAHFKASFDNGANFTENPIAPRDENSIVLSRKHFRCDQRHIYHFFRFWKPDVKLRKSIKKLEEKVLFASTWIQDRVFDVDDVALLSHYFFYFQRRLQRKVVSSYSGYGFMGKGEGKKLYQNNIAIKSTFENVLLEIAESDEKGVVVAMGNDDTLALIDETCLLMKEYVDVHGSGKTENLTFKKGQIGGSGRGPVDEYNLLCDILTQLKEQAKDEGIVEVPGPTYKFLAKDIMYYNDSWSDDAFAAGRKAGWEDWVKKRGLVEPDEDWDLVMR